jgi:hypothetical protein
MLFVFVWLRFVMFAQVVGDEGGPFTSDRGPPGPFRDNVFNPSLPNFYLDTILRSGFFLFVLYSTVVGSGIIARDRHSNAVELYMTRAVTATRYVLGKWFAVASLLAMQVVAPIFLVWVTAVLLAPDWGVLQDTIGFMPRVLLGLGVLCMFHGFLVTAISASTDTPVFGALLWVICMAFLTMMARILRFHFGPSFWTALSPWDACKRIVEAVAGVAAGTDYAVLDAGLSMAVFAVLGVVLIRRGLRSVEAVG